MTLELFQQQRNGSGSSLIAVDHAFDRIIPERARTQRPRYLIKIYSYLYSTLRRNRVI